MLSREAVDLTALHSKRYAALRSWRQFDEALSVRQPREQSRELPVGGDRQIGDLTTWPARRAYAKETGR